MKTIYELLRELAHFTFFALLMVLLSPVILTVALMATHHQRHPHLLRNRYER